MLKTEFEGTLGILGQAGIFSGLTYSPQVFWVLVNST